MSSPPYFWTASDRQDGMTPGTAAVGQAITFEGASDGAWSFDVLVIGRTASGGTLRFRRQVTGKIINGVVTVEDVSNLLSDLLGGLLSGWGVSFVSPGDRLLDVRMTVPAGQTVSAAYVAQCAAQAT